MRAIRIALGRRTVAAALGLLALAAALPATSAAGAPPVIVSETFSHVTETEAILEVVINPEGEETTYHFVLATPNTKKCHDKVCERPLLRRIVLGPGKIPAGTENVKLSIGVTKLAPGQHYSYYVVAGNASGKAHGSKVGFVST